MNVSLTPELDSFVAGKVESGRYNSASEVVREALRLLEDHDRARSLQLTTFNQEIGARLASLDRGESVDPRESRQRLEEKSRVRKKLSA
ncbi:MAG: type II toxin-antitoxin system ParD family antitoxin [Terracidiphilus sp.]|jgi:antitoxin ParD1/3/4